MVDEKWFSCFQDELISSQRVISLFLPPLDILMTQIHILINQLFELRNKLQQEGVEDKVERNLNRIFNTLEEEGYILKNPLGEEYKETRTDCEANIVGKESRHMIISQVIKPIIYRKELNELKLLQKGVVMVESK